MLEVISVALLVAVFWWLHSTGRLIEFKVWLWALLRGLWGRDK